MLTSPRRRRPAILAFHDVRDGAWFRGFLRALRERAKVVALPALVDAHRRRAPLSPCVALTFDDGFRSIRTIVQPVCTELQMPYTTFVCGEVLSGGPAPWFERVGLLVRKVGIARAARYFGVIEGPITNASSMISALKETPLDKLLEALEHAERDAGVDSRSLRDRYLTVADLAEVARDPLATVASHTHRHPILSHLGAADLSAEIGSGLDALRQACRTPIEFFAYPNGKRRDYDERVVASLREAGIRAAVTTAQRPLRGDDDAMALPRLGVSEGDSIAKLDLKWSVPWFSIGDLREAYWRHRSPRILWRTAS